MKQLKLIIIFILLIGGIFLALNWDSIFENKSTISNVNRSKIDVTKKCDEIRKAWEQEKRWNEKLYEEQKTDIEQERLSHRYENEASYETVSSTLKESAVNKACDSYLDLLNDSANFSKSLLEELRNGILTLRNDYGLNDDQRIKNNDDIHSLYTRALQFVESPHKITPSFDTKYHNWTSLEKEKELIVNQAKDITGNPNFDTIKNVPGFSKGLDENNLVELINNQEKTFYLELKNQILKHYRARMATCSNNSSKAASLYNEFHSLAETFAVESEFGFEEIKKFNEELYNLKENLSNNF